MRMLPILMASTVCLAVMAGSVFADPAKTTTRPVKTTTVTKPKSSVEDKSSGTSSGGTGTVTPTPTPTPVTQVATLNAAGEGRRLYLRLNCYGCHGMGAAGAMGPNIVRADSGDVSEAVLQGEGEGMPSYRNLVTATDLQNLTAYLRSIGTTGEPKFNDWWVPFPTK